MKNRRTAALLAIFLGGMGVHKFYLRDTGSGIFYIILTMFSASLGFPIGWILGWIDAFALFSMSDERFDKKYNSGPRAAGRQNRANSRRDRNIDRRNTRSSRNPYENARNRRMESTSSTRRSNNPYDKSKRRKNIIKDNPFKGSGIKYLKEFELDLAIVDLNRALELSPDDQDIHIALGKVYSLEEKTDKSFYHLAKAVELGFTNVKDFREADELAFLRIQDEFEEFESSGYRVIPGKGRSTVADTPEKTSATVPPKGDLLQDDLLLSQLNKLQELRKKGLLSETEFEQEKVKLMGR